VTRGRFECGASGVPARRDGRDARPSIFLMEVDLGCLVGFEPTSSGATVRRSTAELQAPQGGILQPLIIATGAGDVREPLQAFGF